MSLVLVDERRFAAGLDGALAALAANDSHEALSPARLLGRLLDARVLEDGERRAVVRRIAATRDLPIPAGIRRAAPFAARVLAAVDAGAPGVHEAVIDQTRTMLAFAGALDVPSALERATAAAPRAHGVTRLAVDAALLDDAGGGFAWRRLAAAAGIALEPLALAPPEAPVLDRGALAGIVAVLRYAESRADADARHVLVAPIAALDPDEARALIVAAGERSDVLDLIGSWTAGMVPGARDAALDVAANLRAVAAAYRIPDAGAAAVIAEILARFSVEPATAAAVERVARDFDVARAFAPAWTAEQLIDELTAELGEAARRSGVTAPEPAAERAPEPPAAVPVKLRPWSASSLGAYAACARKWYYRYVCAAVEDAGSSASFYGTAFHAALEAFHERFARFDATATADAPALAHALDACVGEAFERHRTRFDAPVEYELQRRRARRTAKRYLNWLLERGRTAPFEVAGCEVSTDVELGGQRFVGSIDRLDRDLRTGTITVVDYKTGSIATSAAEYLEDVLAFREFQLPFYYWARTAAGDRVSRLALVPLKDATLEVAPVELEIVTGKAGRAEGPRGAIGVGDLERARDRMIALARTLAEGDVRDYPATSDPEACRYCAYADACRDRPVALEERFGR